MGLIRQRDFGRVAAPLRRAYSGYLAIAVAGIVDIPSSGGFGRASM